MEALAHGAGVANGPPAANQRHGEDGARRENMSGAPLAPGATGPEAMLAMRRAELLQQLEALTRDNEESGRPRFSNHLAEDAQDHQQRQGIAVTHRLLLTDLHQVEHALAYAASGRYGLCEQCGREIPPRRLQIVPAATLCVGCQAQRETASAVH